MYNDCVEIFVAVWIAERRSALDKRYIAPIVICTITIVLDLIVLYPLFFMRLSPLINGGLVLYLVVSNGLMIYVVRERILEIRGGEEDDLSKY